MERLGCEICTIGHRDGNSHLGQMLIDGGDQAVADPTDAQPDDCASQDRKEESASGTA